MDLKYNDMRNEATKRIDREYELMVNSLAGAMDECQAGDNEQLRMLQERRAWAIDRAKEYGKVLGMRWEDVLEEWEKHRPYDIYYQIYYINRRFPAIVGRRVMTEQEWKERGVQLYGKNPEDWRFRCPVCGHVQIAADAEEQDLGKNNVYRACVVGFEKSEGCLYWAGDDGSECRLIVVSAKGLLPVEVFEFADDPEGGER